MSTSATIVSAVLAVAFLLGGVPKVLRTAFYRERVRHWRLPEGLLPVIGLVEVVSAALLLVGAATERDRLAVAGAALLTATMAGAVLTHVRIADTPARARPAILLAVLAATDVALLVA